MGAKHALLYINDGTGGFTLSTSQPFVPVTRSDAKLRDINEDGHLDLIVCGLNSSNISTAKTYLNDGTGVFVEKFQNELVGFSDGSIELGDVDQDGDLDLVISGKGVNNAATTWLYENISGCEFKRVQNTLFHEAVDGEIKMGDIDGDGDLDIVLNGGGGMAIYYNETIVLTGIEKQEEAVFHVFPNPVKNVLSINRIDIAQLKLVDAMGKMVMISTNNQLNVESLSKGAYYLQITSLEGEIATRILVVE